MLWNKLGKYIVLIKIVIDQNFRLIDYLNLYRCKSSCLDSY